MKVAGTGLHGFIGEHLVRRLKENGHEIVFVPYQKVRLYRPEHFDYLFFLSAHGNHYQQTDAEKTYQANVSDLWRLLLTTREVDYKAFIHFSTSSVLLEKQTMYSATKSAGEKICQGFRERFNKPVISIRPLSVYGIGEADFHFIPTVIRNIMRKEVVRLGNGFHDWIWVDDLIDGVFAVLDNIDEIKGPVNIGTGIQTSNQGVYEKLVEKLDIPATKIDVGRMRDYDTNYWIADTSEIRKFGWGPKTSLDDGLDQVVKNYKEKYAG